MIAYLQYAPQMLGVLSLLVFIHELGHFLAAKYFKVRVETFSIGFGPRLFGFRKGDTDYRLSLLPLGGYVKMAGENPMEESTGDAGEFMAHPRWQRFIIALAGPAMNVVLALGLLTAVYSLGAEVEASRNQPTLVGSVYDNSPAAKAGIQHGDLITEFDGIKNPTWEQTVIRTLLNNKQPLQATLLRKSPTGDTTSTVTVTPEPNGADQSGWIGWAPDEQQFVTELESTMPAAKAGVQVGDEVVSVDGVELHSMDELINLLQKSQAKPVMFAIIRGGKNLTVQVQAVMDSRNGPARYRIGAYIEGPKITIALPLGEAWQRSVAENKKGVLLLGDVLKGLFSGRVGMGQMSGPVGIMKQTADAARQGKSYLARWTAFLSLNLGLFNLLPFPILDGGMILFLLIEGLRRKDISVKIKERIYQAAAVVLVSFTVVIMYSDVVKMLHR